MFDAFRQEYFKVACCRQPEELLYDKHLGAVFKTVHPPLKACKSKFRKKLLLLALSGLAHLFPTPKEMRARYTIHLT